MPTDAQRRNLASAHHVEVQALKDKVAELEKQLENAFSAINYWKEGASSLPQPVPAQQKGCFRCVTPNRCAIYGCCPGTWPSEQPANQQKD